MRLTYAELGTRCRRLAAGLRARGAGRGDRVAVLMGNCHRYLEACTAIPGIGAMITPLNTRHAAAEHQAILRDAAPRLILTDSAHQKMALGLAAGGAAVLGPDAYERLVAGHGEAEFGIRVNERR